MEYSGLKVKFTSGMPQEVYLRPASSKTEKSITVGKKYYEVEGDEKTVKLFHEKIGMNSAKEFKDLKELKITLNSVQLESVSPIATKVFNQKEIQEIVEKVIQCNGSKQEIVKIFSEIPENIKFSLPSLMNIAFNLVEKSSVIKAHLFFSLVPIPGKHMDKCFFNMGKAMLEKGKSTCDLDVLNCSYNYLSAVKFGSPSPPPGIQDKIDEIRVELKKIAENGDLSTKEKANEIDTCIEIRETLASKPAASEKELELLRQIDSGVDRVFKLAEELQNKVNTEKSLLTKPPGEIVKITKAGETIPLHVKITGKREPGDPFVILEGGLGIVSEDWKLVQKNMPKTIQVMSYDRAGMGWSGTRTEKATAENTLANLKLLLKTLDIPPPYLFVGHSYGGFLGQLFAMEHPEQVAGVVLVDSAIEEVIPDSGFGEKNYAFDYLPSAARNDFFRNDRGHFFDEETSPSVHRITSRTLHLETYEEECNEFTRTAEQLTEALNKSQQTPPILCPVKVITALGEDTTNMKKEDFQRFEKFQEGQKNLSSRSVEGTQAYTVSDHFVMYHDPEIVINQISSFFKKKK